MSAIQQRVAVHGWPQGMAQAVQELRAGPALAVISVPTPATTCRGLARECIRTALRETLALYLEQAPASIVLLSRPGQPMEVAEPFSHLHVSVSHMPGLSVAAIGTGAAMGIDVMHVDQGVPQMPDWERVARDYLGAAATAWLQSTPPAQRPAAFAQAWTCFEARLKCLGLGLTEWTPALEQKLAPCHAMALALPENCRGAIARHARGPRPD